MRDFCEELVDETDNIKIKMDKYKKIVEFLHQSTTHISKTKTKKTYSSLNCDNEIIKAEKNILKQIIYFEEM